MVTALNELVPDSAKPLADNLVFKKNLHLDPIDKIQRRRSGWEAAHVELSDDERGTIYPFGKTGSDNSIPNQGFPTAHAKTSEQTAAVHWYRWRAEEKANRSFRIFRGLFVPKFVQPLEEFQPGTFVLVEHEVSFFKICTNRLRKLHMGASADGEVPPEFGEHLFFQVSVALIQVLFVPMSAIIERRPCCQNNQVFRFDEIEMFLAKLLVLLRIKRRIEDNVPVRYVAEDRTSNWGDDPLRRFRRAQARPVRDAAIAGIVGIVIGGRGSLLEEECPVQAARTDWQARNQVLSDQNVNRSFCRLG